MTCTGSEDHEGESIGAKDANHDLGILFVHGIGQQVRGETLVQAGDAMCVWLNPWLGTDPVALDGMIAKWPSNWIVRRFHPELIVKPFSPVWEIAYKKLDLPSCVSIDDTLLKQSHSHLYTPAFAHLKIDSPRFKQSWLLAESWWADSFNPPGFMSLLEWGFSVIPWAIASHFVSSSTRAFLSLNDVKLQEKPRELARLLFAVGGYFFAPVVAVTMLTVAIFLAILSLIPIGGVRSFVLALQKYLSAILGDCQVFLSSPITTASILSRVNHDVQWLRRKGCKSIVIMAHSQGAAIAYYLLKKYNYKEVKLLITYGSGLQKLVELQLATTRDVHYLGYLPILTPLGIWVLWDKVSTSQLLMVSVAIFLASMAWCHWRFRQLQLKAQADLKGKGISPPWIDYFSSSDPISNGPSPCAERAIMVHNRGSVVTDHVTYWDNAEQFVAKVTCELGKIAGLDLSNVSDRDATTLSQSDQRRVSWVRAFRILRGSMICCVVYTVFDLLESGMRLRPDLRTLGTKIVELSSDLTAFFSSAPLITGKSTSPAVVGVLAVLISAALWYQFSFRRLRMIMRAWMAALFGRRVLSKKQNAFMNMAIVGQALLLAVIFAGIWKILLVLS